MEPADELEELGHAIAIRGFAGARRADHQLPEHHLRLLARFRVRVLAEDEDDSRSGRRIRV